MFAFFNLGLQELIILAFLALVPLGALLAVLLVNFGTKKRNDED
jgi:hypothetical protein